jgi:hypothetical protein
MTAADIRIHIINLRVIVNFLLQDFAETMASEMFYTKTKRAGSPSFPGDFESALCTTHCAEKRENQLYQAPVNPSQFAYVPTKHFPGAVARPPFIAANGILYLADIHVVADW